MMKLNWMEVTVSYESRFGKVDVLWSWSVWQNSCTGRNQQWIRDNRYEGCRPGSRADCAAGQKEERTEMNYRNRPTPWNVVQQIQISAVFSRTYGNGNAIEISMRTGRESFAIIKLLNNRKKGKYGKTRCAMRMRRSTQQ